MALNPKITKALEPIREKNEHFILEVNNIDFEIILEN